MNTNSYTRTAKLLHWAMALLIFGLFAVGFYMADLPLSPWKLKIYSWHKWAGVTAFLLLAIRLAWRVGHRPPEMPTSMSPTLRGLAYAGHGLLYLLMIAVPLSGWLMSSAKGFQTVYFGLLPIPDLLVKNKELGDLLREIHENLNLLFVLLVAGHVAAALKHHTIDRDDILVRMLPGRKKS